MASTTEIKIKEIEEEMARTQKNKATAKHLGLLKARLAKLRQELLAPKTTGGDKGEGFDVAKTGHARIGFVGKRQRWYITALQACCWAAATVLIGHDVMELC
eukprot:TRINITY_DN8326_c0_g1_i4.p2 TRINITY_DN8326_c0_g1~~TRINITY_DN8326_c0_g1_i4.p2  ORF type:complete len:102 (+),score=9.97 TRINITY_DN8326_c0_g1_i4:148-453(+)